MVKEFPNFVETEYSVLCYEKPVTRVYPKKHDSSLQGVTFHKTVSDLLTRFEVVTVVTVKLLSAVT
jgi:hypothetical protein